MWTQEFRSRFEHAGDNGTTIDARLDSAFFVSINANGDSTRVIARGLDQRASTVVVGDVIKHTPFVEQARVAVSQDAHRIGFLAWHALTSTSGRYTVTVVGAKGDTVFSRSFPCAAAPIPSNLADGAVAQAVRDARAELASRGEPFDDAAAADLRRRLRAAVPLSRPCVSEVRFGVDNTTWVRLPRDRSGLSEWLGLDEHGQAFGTVGFSEDKVFRNFAISRANLWLIEVAASGVPSVVRYRIEPSR